MGREGRREGGERDEEKDGGEEGRGRVGMWGGDKGEEIEGGRRGELYKRMG